VVSAGSSQLGRSRLGAAGSRGRRRTTSTRLPPGALEERVEQRRRLVLGIQGPDGAFAALDGRRLYVEAKTAGYIHEAAFRHELHRELGVEWAKPQRGMADIEGVPAGARRAFSRRRREIEAYARERGDDSRAARQVAAYRTRRGDRRSRGAAQIAPRFSRGWSVRRWRR
jgi:TrwC relaxase